MSQRVTLGICPGLAECHPFPVQEGAHYALFRQIFP